MTDWVFYLCCALAVLLVMLALLLILRARGLGFAVGRWVSRAFRWVFSVGVLAHKQMRSVLQAVRESVAYFREHSESVYQIPRVLMLGEPGSGRREIMAALERAQPAARAVKPLVQGRPAAGWHTLQSGVVVAPASAGTGKGAWRRSVLKLDEERPARPVDGLVVTVSASLLLSGARHDLESVAERLFKQIFALQKHWGFTLPVYLIVTKLDCVPGFLPFWKALGGEPQQILGWSNPAAPELHFDEKGADRVFEQVLPRMQSLQLSALAQGQVAEAVEAFLLFPRHFEQLRKPLKVLCRLLFAKTAYQASLAVRGVYFCGDVDGTASPGLLNELFETKIFAEHNLASPVEQRVWSRSRVLRRLQLASLAGFGLLSLALVASASHLAWRAEHQQRAVQVAAAANPTFNKACPPLSHVETILQQGALTEASNSYLAIPLSWLDSRPRAARIRFVTQRVLQPVLFPALRCRLAEQAAQYASAVPSPKAPSLVTGSTSVVPSASGAADPSAEASQGAWSTPLERVAALLRWEQQRRVFSELAVSSPRRHLPEASQDLAHLVEATLSLSATQAFPPGSDVALEALRQLTYPDQVVPKLGVQRRRMSEALLALGHLHRTRLQTEATVAVDACQRLGANSGHLREDLETVAEWSRGAGAAWALASAEDNPCLTTQRALRAAVAALENEADDYPHSVLLEAVDLFSAEACYAPVASALAKVNGTWCGGFLRAVPSKTESTTQRLLGMVGLASASAPEEETPAEALQELAKAPFIQDAARPGFHCTQPKTWLLSEVRAAKDAVVSYQRLAAQAGALGGAELPGVRQRLLSVVAGHLQAAQGGVFAAPTSGSSLAAGGAKSVAVKPRLSQDLSQRFSAVVPDWVQLLSLLTQLEFSPNEVVWLACFREFAVQGLAKVAQQWGTPFEVEPAPHPRAAAGRTAARHGAVLPAIRVAGAGPFLNQVAALAKPSTEERPLFVGLKDAASAETAFAIELARMNELAQEAQPFLQVISASAWLNPTDKGQRELVQRLQDTLTEVLVHDPGRAGAIVALRKFFTDVLGGLTAANCHKRLQSLEPVLARDEFTYARQRLFSASHALCEKQDLGGLLGKYQVVVDAFQQLLHNRFPFAALSNPDVSVQNVSAMAQLLGTPEVAQLELGAELPLQQAFLNRLRESVSFLHRYVEEGTPLQVGVGFRAQRGRTRQDQDILSWTLQSGVDVAFFPNGPNQISWSLGDPVSLSLRWANRSVFQPTQPKPANDLAVKERLASFRHAGAWALLRLIEAHRGPEASGEEGGLSLRFGVPLQARGVRPAEPRAARVYLSISLKAAEGTPLQLRKFPHWAPPAAASDK